MRCPHCDRLIADYRTTRTCFCGALINPSVPESFEDSVRQAVALCRNGETKGVSLLADLVRRTNHSPDPTPTINALRSALSALADRLDTEVLRRIADLDDVTEKAAQRITTWLLVLKKWTIRLTDV